VKEIKDYLRKGSWKKNEIKKEVKVGRKYDNTPRR